MTSRDLAEALGGITAGGWVEVWAPGATFEWHGDVVVQAVKAAPDTRYHLRVGVGERLAGWHLKKLMAVASKALPRLGDDWPDVWHIGRRRGSRPNCRAPRLAGVCAHPACRAPLPEGKRVWCSEWCITLWYAQFTDERLRSVVLERDALRCQLCETLLRPGNCWVPCWQGAVKEMDERARLLPRHDTHDADLPALEARAQLRALRQRQVGEVDHVQPIQYGGDEWDARNCRTLCQRCHAGERRHQREQYADAWERTKTAPPQLRRFTGTELWVPLGAWHGAPVTGSASE